MIFSKVFSWQKYFSIILQLAGEEKEEKHVCSMSIFLQRQGFSTESLQQWQTLGAPLPRTPGPAEPTDPC